MGFRIIFFSLFIAVCLCSNGYGASPSWKEAQYQHDPYQEEECSSCHNSDEPGADDIISEAPQLCYECHSEQTGKFGHSPHATGACLICHNPHGSDNERMLNEKIPDLCFMCHEFLERKMGRESNSTHDPAVDNCTACHNPHVSDVSNKMLRKKMKLLCTECHMEEDISTPDFEGATHKHGPVESEKACVNCHDPHASPFDYHLKAEPMDLCLQCHNKKVTAYDSKELTNIKELLQKEPDHHGPIKEKNCSGCHNPHGSTHFRILLNEYPKGFYTQEFNMDLYKLCFSCHESTILKNKETSTLTNFRNGKRNLHYLHVRNPQKGRTCRACHEIHASSHPKHIRDFVTFGKFNWPLELKYRVEYTDTKTGKSCDTPSATCIKSGGSCQGCHKRFTYSFSSKQGVQNETSK